MTSSFRPARAILELDSRFYREVAPAAFPQHIIRWRHQRWAQLLGLGELDTASWTRHFGAFAPFEGSIEAPLALAYHGHQFGTYNPFIGDGRGFLFAQMLDEQNRLLDFGTKGSGRTPWSRTGDGRLTLKGGVREVLAAGMLEALGVYTSKAFSLIETGESLSRHDEPSPTRSSVLVRLSHSHIRFGTFQRLSYEGDAEGIGRLVEYCIRHYYPHAQGTDMAASAAGLLHEIIKASARLAAQWMAAGFVHGVLNTDNMVVTGESFDYGPWRFLPYSDPSFTAAYFDENGLYAYGRQPSAVLWNLSQLAGCLSLVSTPSLLEAELKRFEAFYRLAFRKNILGLLGLKSGGDERDIILFKELFGWMAQTRARWPQVFFDWFCGAASEQRAAASPLSELYRQAPFETARRLIMEREPDAPGRLLHPYFAHSAPVSLVIEEVEAIWRPIAEADDWSRFRDCMDHIEKARQALALTTDSDKEM